MPKGTNQKFKLYRLAQVMLKETDEEHFITVKKTRELIGKLEKMVSRYEASELQRQVFVAKRIKTMNESVYYTVDVIHRAIAENRKIEFQYFQWNVKKEMDLRHGGAWYQVSPWGLSWDDENYYLVAYDAGEEKIKHYRVDKMRGLRMLEKPREGEGNLAEKVLVAIEQEKKINQDIHQLKGKVSSNVGAIIETILNEKPEV